MLSVHVKPTLELSDVPQFSPVYTHPSSVGGAVHDSSSSDTCVSVEQDDLSGSTTHSAVTSRLHAPIVEGAALGNSLGLMVGTGVGMAVGDGVESVGAGVMIMGATVGNGVVICGEG